MGGGMAWRDVDTGEWVPVDEVPFGQVSDVDIAQRFGKADAYVARERRARGIKPARKRTSARGIDWDAVPLGELPDPEIARALGVTTGAVHHQRKKRGIKAFSDTVADEEAAYLRDVLPHGVVRRVPDELWADKSFRMTTDHKRRFLLSLYVTADSRGAVRLLLQEQANEPYWTLDWMYAKGFIREDGDTVRLAYWNEGA